MSKLIKKFFAIATTLTVAVMLVGPVPAKALTAAELQEQINTLMATLAALQAQLTELEGGSTSGTNPADCSGITFDRNLKVGMTGSDVKCLQALLNTASDTQLASSGAGSPGNETTYFGNITKGGVIKFQEKYASETLAPWGLTTGTGFVGSTSRAKLNELLSVTPEPEPEPEPEPTPVPTTGLKISLASDTPISGVVPYNAVDLPFTKLNFTAGSDSAKTITKIIVKRGGVSANADIENIKLFEGDTQVGSTQAVNTITHKVTFSALSWTIPAGTTKTLTIKSGIPSSGATVGNQIKLGIATNDDIVVSGGATVEGAPIYGNGLTISGSTVGTFDVDFQTTPAAGDVISGATDQHVATLRLAATTEGFDLNSITLTEKGTSAGTDVKNIKLKYLGDQVGNTVALLNDNDQAVFTGSPIISVRSGTVREVDVYVDVAEGVISERTIQFEITETDDVSAVGQNTGGGVLITDNDGGAGTAYTVEESAAQSIKQGTITLTWDAATNPSATYVSVGSEQNKIGAMKFSAGSREGVRITKLKLTEGGSISSSEYQNVQLYIDGSADSTGHVGSVSGSLVTFSDANGLFTIPKSGNAVVMIKADISTATTDGDTIRFYINAITDVVMEGAESNDKIYSDSSHITISAVDTAAEATAHTVRSSGTLTITNSPTTPAGVNLTGGEEDLEIMQFRLSAEYEDMTVSSIKVRIWTDSDLSDAGSDTAATSTGDLSELQLWDGSTLLKEISTPAAGYVTFSTNLTVEKDTTKTLTVKADVPTDTTLFYLGMTVGAYSGHNSVVTVANELTTTGKSSSQDITETGGAAGNVFTFQTATLTVASASAPAAHTVVQNTSEHWMGRLQLAGVYEPIKVTTVIISFSDDSALGEASSANDIFTNVKIKNGTTQIGTTKQISDAAGNSVRDNVTFSGIENLTIGKNQTIALDIYADIGATSTDVMAWYVGHASSGDIVGSGLESSSSISSTGGTQASNAITTLASGTLAIGVNADTPVAANVAVGTTHGQSGVEIAKLDFTATYEDVKIKTLRFTLTDPNTGSGTTTAGNRDIDKVYIYDGSTKLAETTVDTGGSTYTFTNEAGLFTIGNTETETITVKADFFGLSLGAISGDAPSVYIADVTAAAQVLAEGVSSNTAITASAGTPAPTTSGNFGAMYLYQTTVTVALNSASPSGSQSGGAAKELIRFDVTADSRGKAEVDAVYLTLNGTVDVTGATDAYLYKSTDLTTELAKEVNRSVLNPGSSGASYTVATTTAATDFTGIPAGATLHIYDSSAGTYMNTKFTKLSSSSNLATATFSTITNIFQSETDDIYYYPAQPGNGKLYFGARTILEADATNTPYRLSVADASGFAVGDTVEFLNAFTATGTAVTSAGCTVIGFDTTTTPNYVYLDDDVVGSTNLCELTGGTINYSYYEGSGSGTEIDAIIEPVVVYASGATNELGSSGAGDPVAAGTTKTYVVKGDTTGATATETINVSIAAATDLIWDDNQQDRINARTLTFPVQTSLNY